MVHFYSEGFRSKYPRNSDDDVYEKDHGRAISIDYHFSKLDTPFEKTGSINEIEICYDAILKSSYSNEELFSTLEKFILKNPDKISCYAILVGFLYHHNKSYGVLTVRFLSNRLNETLKLGQFDSFTRLLWFCSECVNVNLVSEVSVLILIEKIIKHIESGTNLINLCIDFYLYSLLTALPFVAKKLDTNSEYGFRLDKILKSIELIFSKRTRTYIRSIRAVTMNRQQKYHDDYLKLAFDIVKKLVDEDWNWKSPFMRLFENVCQEMDKNTPIDLFEVNLPESDVVLYESLPQPRVYLQLFSEVDTAMLNVKKSLPSPLDMGRFLCEEKILTIIKDASNNSVENIITELVGLTRNHAYAMKFLIIEVIIKSMLSIPRPLISDIMVSKILKYLCISDDERSYTSIISLAFTSILSLVDHLNIDCIHVLVNWFSFYVSNNNFIWQWEEVFELYSSMSVNFRLFFEETLLKMINLSTKEEVMVIKPDNFPSLLNIIQADRSIRYDYNEGNIKDEELLKLRSLIRENVISGNNDELIRILGNIPTNLVLPINETSLDCLKHIPPNRRLKVDLFFQMLLQAKNFSIFLTVKFIMTFQKTIDVIFCQEEDQLSILYTTYKCYIRNPLRIKALFIAFWKEKIVSPSMVIKFLFDKILCINLNKFFVWEIVDEILEYYHSVYKELLEKQFQEQIKKTMFSRSNSVSYSRSEEREEEELSNDNFNNDKGLISNGLIKTEFDFEYGKVVLLVISEICKCYNHMSEDINSYISHERSITHIIQRLQGILIRNCQVLFKEKDKVYFILNEKDCLKEKPLLTIADRFNSLYQ